MTPRRKSFIVKLPSIQRSACSWPPGENSLYMSMNELTRLLPASTQDLVLKTLPRAMYLRCKTQRLLREMNSTYNLVMMRKGESAIDSERGRARRTSGMVECICRTSLFSWRISASDLSLNDKASWQPCWSWSFARLWQWTTVVLWLHSQIGTLVGFVCLHRSSSPTGFSVTWYHNLRDKCYSGVQA
jgi:hypothetical protein